MTFDNRFNWSAFSCDLLYTSFMGRLTILPSKDGFCDRWQEKREIRKDVEWKSLWLKITLSSYVDVEPSAFIYSFIIISIDWIPWFAVKSNLVERMINCVFKAINIYNNATYLVKGDGVNHRLFWETPTTAEWCYIRQCGVRTKNRELCKS